MKRIEQNIPKLYLIVILRWMLLIMPKEYINRLISPDKRATVLSVKNMIGRFLFTIIGPFIGWTRDAYTFKTAFLPAGGAFFCLAVDWRWCFCESIGSFERRKAFASGRIPNRRFQKRFCTFNINQSSILLHPLFFLIISIFFVLSYMNYPIFFVLPYNIYRFTEIQQGDYGSD